MDHGDVYGVDSVMTQELIQMYVFILLLHSLALYYHYIPHYVYLNVAGKTVPVSYGDISTTR